MNSSSNLKKNKLTAFTLIELLICLTIISIMAVMSISAYPKFSEQISLSGETYKMLAYFRENQSYGVSAVSTPGVKFVYAFLVNKTDSTIKSVSIESPSDKTNTYYTTTASIDPTAKVLSLKSQFEIEKIDGISNTSTTSLDQAYSFFKRPNPEARLIGLQGTNIYPDIDAGSFNRIEITLRSKNNNAFKKKIVILQTGQMYVNDW